MIKFILSDIEGTTTSISFVHDVLFPYSLEKIGDYIEKHIAQTPVRELAEYIWMTDLDPSGSNQINLPCLKNFLEDLIKTDQKYGPLKSLQGLIWREGYQTKNFTGHLYSDVPAYLKKWTSNGLEIGIFSSGSVEAQQLLFRYSDYGDMSNLISFYFDTVIGSKRNQDCYREIARQLKAEPKSVLFLSDIFEELEAAQYAGMQVCQIMRPNFTGKTLDGSSAKNFEEVSALFKI